MRNTAPHAAGCVVFRATPAGVHVLLIHDQYGHWTFPKGHLEAGEASATAAIREVYEETGIQGDLGALVQTIFYDVVKKDRLLRKQVDFFVMHTTQHTVALQASEGIRDYCWADTSTAYKLLSHDQIKTVLTAALTAIAQSP